jgi:uncharacterized membrane protein
METANLFIKLYFGSYSLGAAIYIMIFWAAAILSLFWLMVKAWEAVRPGQESPLDLLERYAKGEIDKEQYMELKKKHERREDGL